jgi:hypothetical protein
MMFDNLGHKLPCFSSAGVLRMRRWSVPIAIAALMQFPAELVAQEGMIMDARNFLAVCSAPDESWVSFCNGYVQAVFDSAWRPGSSNDICPPAGTSRTQLVQQSVAYLSVLPNLDTANAAQIIHAIFREVYPCR